MKKVFLIFTGMFIVSSCTYVISTQEKEHDKISDVCDNISDIDWKDKATTINIYETCITSGRTSGKIKRTKTDSKLYLSYIYLSEGEYKNIEQANVLLRQAIAEMSTDCDGSHGTYDNFCYMVHFPEYEKIPEEFRNLEDAMHLFNMSLPCVYKDMILENPRSIELLNPYFGSSRDAAIPGICNPFNPYIITGIRKFIKIENYQNIEKLNPVPAINGTISFTISQGNYRNAVEVLLFPEKVFTDINSDDISLDDYENKKNNELKRYKGSDLEREIYKYTDLAEQYKKMISDTKVYYMTELNLDDNIASKYAKKTVLLIILRDIYHR